ncbi:hypothetical protein SmJEL517_g05824 [Synchytrium microbalum]|uniref:Cation-transporting P-type ATPase N-terminal domain-containing protein n=1 Tax=Synchytrium microbalum TaxID=1806994 RepID=A0A507BSP0_9FUNG|nr:uncharacterized protein SmJEL517_g05824 [Synchytrium microbalum]TPX30672.1 hypothetical protein SmJEL517_g05824 [Synchytrium microbalum]
MSSGKDSGLQEVDLSTVPLENGNNASKISAKRFTPVAGKKGASDAAEKEADRTKHVDITEHLMPIDEVLATYKTAVNSSHPVESPGLSNDEAKARLLRDGPNMLSPPKKRNVILRFLDILLGLFNLMLLLSGAAAYILYGIDPADNFQNVYLGAILIAVAFMNAGIEFYQIQKSQAILESFLNLIPAKSYVVRSGKLAQISAVELVKGDIVYIRMGDKVPADVILFASTELKVDNSSLTGEAEPQERNKNNTMTSPLEAHNLVFNGTLAVNGEGYGIVIRTGDYTVIGQIASLTSNEQRRSSPLSSEIDAFVHIIAAVAGVVAIIFFLIGLLGKGLGFSYSLNFAIGTFVSFVPEGLPATVTMLLTFAAKRMAGRNVLVKDLQGVETLGAITLLATDKTGTLTRNQMTVTYMWTGGVRYYAQDMAAGSAESQTSEPLNVGASGVQELLYMSALCSRAKFDRDDVPVDQRQVVGDATEAGLLKCAATKLSDFDGLPRTFPKVFEIPFNSETKWHMSIHQKAHANGDLMLYIKGAPERILKLCNQIWNGESIVPITDADLAKFDEMYKFMASKGHRVLAFAALPLPRTEFPANFEFTKEPPTYPSKDFAFYGLISLEDPPKHGVREAIGHCREAGIRVMMVTGDHPLTAEAIGRKINLMLEDTREMVAAKKGKAIEAVKEDEYDAIVIHGEMIDSMTDADWNRVFNKREIIFARTSPRHKLDIVKRAQSRGEIVGVTGDGVNDSPALKKADLGIAMNQSGSDVSKEAAAMILLDDNFASCVNGIEEGRLIFQNLKKSIQYTVTHTMPEVYANLFFLLVPLPLPLSSVLILVVDLGFELFIALAYAFDPAETKTGLMKLRPRKPVTPASIARFRRDEGRKLRASASDADKKPGIIEHTIHHLKSMKRMFTRQYWSELMEDKEEEVLVDQSLLAWAYLEAGTIQTIGCFVSFFVVQYYYFGITPFDLQQNATDWGKADIPLARGGILTSAQQNTSLAYGQSMYYLAIMFQQAFNHFICKARLGLPWGSFMLANKYSFYGLAAGATFTLAIVYIPPFNIAFGTEYHLLPLFWLIPIGFGILLYVYAIVRTIIIRMRSPVRYNPDISGLQMYATRWSVRGATGA